MVPKIPERIRDERSSIIKKIVERSNLEYRKMFIGKTLEVIVETKKNGHYSGKSENYLDICIQTEIKLEAKKKYKTLFNSIEQNFNMGRVVEL
jgi:tRNA A37 methylthiotransferase MiaB